MSGPFSIDPKHIKILDEREFVALMNWLIAAEVESLGQAPGTAQLTDSLHEQDLGIDARVRVIDISATPSTWLPPGLTVWQYKTRIKGPSQARKEFGKRGVQDAMLQGGHYVLAVGDDFGDKRRANIQKALQDECTRLGLNPEFTVLNGEQIARWAERYPAVFLAFEKLKRPLGRLKDHKQWSLDPRHAVKYHEDESRANAREAIRSFARKAQVTSVLRVVGPSGVGKTRLVLESLAEDGLKQLSVYADEFTGVPDEFLGWVSREPRASCILVVDECEWRDAERLRGYAACNPRLKIIAIASGQSHQIRGTPPPDVLPVVPLAHATMDELLRESFPDLDRSQRDWVVHLTGGFVKLAVEVAQAILRQPSLPTATTLIRQYNIDNILRNLFPDPDDMLCMKTISLLHPIGWEGDVRNEREAACRFLGAPEHPSISVCAAMVARGLVRKRGRYRYITPELLAIWLSDSAWHERQPEMQDFLDTLPTAKAQEAFFRRLRSLSDPQLTGPFIEQILTDPRRFVDMSSINSEDESRVFAMLAETAPDSGLTALERILSPLSKAQLLRFRAGRRHVVWTLEKLVRPQEFFHRAARLLLALAEAENETWSNNATAIWLQLFRPYLSGTEVPGRERLAFLRELYETEHSHDKRRLIIQAAGAAFELRDISRGSEGEMLGGYAPRQEWWPRTPQEHKQMIQSAMSLIESALADRHADVRTQAFEELVKDAWPFFAFGLGLDFLQALDKANPLGDDKRTFKARESLEFLFYHFKDQLPEPQRAAVRERLKSLTGLTFHHRLRRWVGPPTQADWRPPVEERLSERSAELEQLADEALADFDKLSSELEWLSSAEAPNAANFGLMLGERDAKSRLLTQLEDLGRKGLCELLLAAYVRGRAPKEGTEWLRLLLDRWIESERRLAPAALQCLFLAPATARAGRQVVRLLKKGWLSASDIQGYPFIRWARNLPATSVRASADVLLHARTIESCESAARLLSWWLDEHPGQLSDIRDVVWHIRDVVWRTIESPAAVGTRASWGREWASLARRVAPEDPPRAVSALLKIYQGDPNKAPTLQVDDRLKFLRDLTQQYPDKVWPLVGEALLKKGLPALRLHLALQGWYAQCIPAEIMVAWCESHGPDGPYVAASLCPLHGVPLADPARLILVRFGEDKHVRSRLRGNLLSGSFTGSIVAWLQSHLENVRQWKADPEPNVRKWASEAEQEITGSINHWKAREDEEDIDLL